ncbi:MAG TPA: hypothetical protein VLE53_01455 [Gemmatimonadaceae bacterium]|nr:hypothetical protein [Gemmatimonadaceae bacterium]
MTRLVLVAALAAGLALPARAQIGGVRFEITQVGDTTIAFPRGRARWVKPGQVGIAVDPRRRDALVAQFRVVAVDSGMASAVITGSTTRPLTDPIAILQPPARAWFKTPHFWGSLLIGFALGAMTGASF